MYDAFCWIVDNTELFGELYGDKEEENFQEIFEQKCIEVSAEHSFVHPANSTF